jgi:exonuclease VII small subunit
MVYGERHQFEAALSTLDGMARRLEHGDGYLGRN